MTYKFALRDAVDLQASCRRSGRRSCPEPEGCGRRLDHVPVVAGGGTSVDLSKREARVDSLSLTGVRLVIGWSLMARSIYSNSRSRRPHRRRPRQFTPGAAPVARVPAGRRRPWLRPRGPCLDICQFGADSAGGRISTEDRSTSPAVRVLLRPLSLTVGGVSSDWRSRCG